MLWHPFSEDLWKLIYLSLSSLHVSPHCKLWPYASTTEILRALYKLFFCFCWINGINLNSKHPFWCKNWCYSESWSRNVQELGIRLLCTDTVQLKHYPCNIWNKNATSYTIYRNFVLFNRILMRLTWRWGGDTYDFSMRMAQYFLRYCRAQSRFIVWEA